MGGWKVQVIVLLNILIWKKYCSYLIVTIIIVEMMMHICQWMIQTVSSSGLKTILVFPFAHVVAAMWEHPAGLHCRAVFPDKPAAPLPAAKHRLLLHLDPSCRPCKGWAQREYSLTNTKSLNDRLSHFLSCCNNQGRNSADTCASQMERTS